VGPWTIDGYIGVRLFTANDVHFPGHSRRTQDPILSGRAHVSRALPRRFWIAFDATGCACAGRRLLGEMMEWYASVEYKNPVRARNSYAGAETRLQGTIRRAAEVTRFLAERDARLLFGSDTPSAQLHTNPPGLNGRLEMDNWMAAGVSEAKLFRAMTIDNARVVHSRRAKPPRPGSNERQSGLAESRELCLNMSQDFRSTICYISGLIQN
jgi:hypothetical protein